MIKSRQKGYSPKRSIEFVKNIVAKTDRLLELRERFTVDEPSDERRRIITLETKLVRRIRQQLLFEFATWSCHSRDQAWRENSFYTLDSLQSYGRMSAGIMTMRAFERPQIARYAVITALASNAVATINPILDNLAAIYIRKHQERKIASQIPIERPTTAPPDLEQLQQELANDGHPGGHQDWLRRVAALNLRTEKVDVALDRETKDIERYRQIAQQQTFSGPLIGLTGVASSTLATVAVYGYPRDIRTATRLGLAGRITQGTGQAYALVYTPYTIFSGMLRNHRLRKRHELPTQLLQERLARLEKIQIQ